MSDGNLTLTNVFFSNNRAISGGAIYEAKGTLSVVNSNFSGNIAGIGGDGGAIFNGSGSLSVIRFRVQQQFGGKWRRCDSNHQWDEYYKQHLLGQFCPVRRSHRKFFSQSDCWQLRFR